MKLRASSGEVILFWTASHEDRSRRDRRQDLRLSTFVPQVGPTGFTFNQFLIDADEPLLFHYGQRALFPLVSDAVKRVIPLDRLRWTTCSHVEADESGALNQWLAAAPNATPAHGQVGCNIWLTDMADRPPRVLKNDEVLDLGGKKVRWLDTPHVPHNWDAGVIFEETTGTLFSSDLFTQFGPADATTESDIVGPAIATEKAVPYMPVTTLAEPTLRRLAGACAHDDRADARADLQGRWRGGARRRWRTNTAATAQGWEARPELGRALQSQRREIAPADRAVPELDAVEILRDGAIDQRPGGLSPRVPSAKATISSQPSGRGIDTTVEGVSRFL